MNTTLDNGRLQYEEVQPSNVLITNPSQDIVWHITQSGDYWTIYNAAAGKYAASTGAANKAQLLASDADDKALWSVTAGSAGSAASTYDFTNKQNSANSVNATLRRNGTYGFACYATGTGSALTLYRLADDTSGDFDYYQAADGKTGAALKTAMCGIIYDHTELGYDNLWEAYQTTDVRSDGKIWDMYSNITNYDPYSGPHNNSSEGSGFNREHSFPKSWFGGVMPMYTDLHHLYPVDGNINTRRSNYPYGETDGEAYKSTNDFSKLGTCTYPGYEGTVFEPADEYKGDLARTYFYMVTCYEEKLPDWFANYASTEVVYVIDGSTYPGLQAWQLAMLMKWAKNDPVSEKETNRNNTVFAKQGNRNPFIDYPGLQEYIWGSLTNSEFSNDNYLQPVYMSFSQVETMAAVGEDFVEPTLTTNPAGLTVTYSSSDETVAIVDAVTGEMTLVDDGTATITATFAGNDSYNVGTASYRLTVGEPSLVYGQKLLYEGMSKYSGNADATNAITNQYANLDCKTWSTLEKIYAGGGGYANDGCLKFGTTSGAGSMTSGPIALTGKATLTFYLKQYGSDTGVRLNVAVTGATADATQFTPASDWTPCVVHLTNATGAVTITLSTSSKRAYVDEITLISSGQFELANGGDNVENISAAAANTAAVGCTFDVTLQGRTLYRDGAWNTLTLPFPLSAEQIASSLSGAEIRTLSSASFADGTMTLEFTPATGSEAVTSIAAGTPYIIRWDGGNDIVNPTFTDVTISSETHPVIIDDIITFAGTYAAQTFDVENRSLLFLGSANTLYYPQSGATIGAQRAYFQLADGLTAGDNDSAVKHILLNLSDDETGIEMVQWSMADGRWSMDKNVNGQGPTVNGRNGQWYDLSGRRLDGRPTVRGVYVVNGRKVVVK
ncbi:MAG: endonuclease [Bacteroidaceae bacterium]|nr:endonuclease [Bacteroidaceae bacterium]